MNDLPQRRPGACPVPGKLWLPELTRLVAKEPLFYRPGAGAPRGKAWLRAWETPEDGRFVVLTWVSGLAIAPVARVLHGMLAERFGSPFALAELSGVGIDLILPPAPGREQEWLRLFPAADGPHRAELDAWWGTYGDTVLSA